MMANFTDEFKVRLKDLLDRYEDLEGLNNFLKDKTGIRHFFNSSNEVEKYKEFLEQIPLVSENNEDLGDFQTPSHLTDSICKYFFDTDFKPNILLEPTCGEGNFVISAIKWFPSLKYVYCVEAQNKYEPLFKLNVLKLSFEQQISANIEFHLDNIYTHRFSEDFMNFLNNKDDSVLILGNPPWLTNTQLSILNSDNLPTKSNIKGYRGIEAITGKGNFDIAEYIILLMIQKFSYRRGKIAMLCKSTVIKNIVRDMDKLSLGINNIKTLRIDAKKEFNVNADGGLFISDFGSERGDLCTVSSIYNIDSRIKKFGWIDNKFVSNIELYKKHKHLDGKSPFEWRQGVKHDASKVFILKSTDGDFLLNGLGEKVDVEEELLYPFIRGTELKKDVIEDTDKQIIITQKSPSEDTDYIHSKFPRLWDYLISHSEYLDNRKSIIYKNRPKFSIFGIGDYSFKTFKVAISGFYKVPRFSLGLPINNKPVMLDDTCYFLSFKNFNDAFFTWLLLNLDNTKDFLASIVFLDSKRPYTKEILMRIDIPILLETITFSELMTTYHKKVKHVLKRKINEDDFLKYKDSLLQEKLF